MSIELENEIIASVRDAEHRDSLSSDDAMTIWRNILSLYRLRLHEDYLIEINSLLPRLSSIVENAHPNFGRRVSSVINGLVKSEIHQRELFSTIYPEMGIDYLRPATESEKELITILGEIESEEDVPPGVQDKVLVFLNTKSHEVSN
jgi:hypothetical protein